MNGSNDFRELRNLLSLKRHEQPPPGYFESFSSRVIARIERDEAEAQHSWWDKLLAMIEFNPVGACVYGLVLFLTLLLGINFYQSEATPISRLWSAPSASVLSEPRGASKEGLRPANVRWLAGGEPRDANDEIKPERLFSPSLHGSPASYPRMSPAIERTRGFGELN